MLGNSIQRKMVVFVQEVVTVVKLCVQQEVPYTVVSEHKVRTVRCNNDNCGMVCNWCEGAWEALGYGGDTGKNCCGQLSETKFPDVVPTVSASSQQHVATPRFICRKWSINNVPKRMTVRPMPKMVR